MAPWLSWLAANLVMLLMSLSGYSRHYVATDHGPLHYFEVTGSGEHPPVLLLHGLGSQASDLYLVMEGLRPHVRKLIAVDLPGHGQSEVAVAQLPLSDFQTSVYQGLDRILAQEEPVMLFGNSLGGWQALRYAQHNPAELSSLVLVSPAGAVVDANEARRLRQVFGEQSTAQPEALIPLLYNEPPAWQGAIRPFLYSRFAQPGVQALIRRLDGHRFHDPTQLRQLQMPVLLIWGLQDKIFPVGVDFFRQALPPQTHVIEPPHFTHSPYIEGQMDRELSQLIVNWALRP